MRSYLGLIPISAKIRRRSNRMTILCIMISVFLVTAIFSITDMFMRIESGELLDKHGNWHIKLENISQDIAEEIRLRPDVTALGWAEAYNTDASEPYYIGEKKAALYGTDSTYMTQLVNAIEEGTYPQEDNQVILSSNAQYALHVKVGDYVELQTPETTIEVQVSGFGSDDKDAYQGQNYLVAVYMTQNAFSDLMQKNGISSNPTCYVQFQTAAKASDAVSEIREQYHLSESDSSENTALMALSGKSNSKTVKRMYGMAAGVAGLVLLAGVLMISGSMNSNVAQRAKFFGMMRCIGASRQQIIRYVRMEALNWCKTAVPIGLIAGILVSWGICAFLHYGIGREFLNMPVFRLSPVGLVCGTLMGIVTVLLAAQLPARKASKVSPMAAVSGNTKQGHSVQHPAKLKRGRVETTLGRFHATASRKNWFLMTASFSLSIILFFCFSIGLKFANCLLPSLRKWQPDIVLNGYANERVLSRSLSDTIASIPGVAHIYGCSYIENVPVTASREEIQTVNLVSYSDFLMDSVKDSVVQGDISDIYGDSHQVMTFMDKDNPLKVGDTVKIAGNEVEITGMVSSGLFSGSCSIICSPETFERLTGEQNYSLIGIQLNKDATDETVLQISDMADTNVIFSDMRESNYQDKATYLATVFIVYSFLAIVAMITVFNIINSISMSVIARTKQYGTMRAIGMDSRQLIRMIAAEAFTYAISGLIVGSGIGIICNYYLYTRLITQYFGMVWKLPVGMLIMVLLFDLASAVAAVYAPAKRICNMAITENINEL